MKSLQFFNEISDLLPVESALRTYTSGASSQHAAEIGGTWQQTK